MTTRRSRHRTRDELVSDAIGRLGERVKFAARIVMPNDPDLLQCEDLEAIGYAAIWKLYKTRKNPSDSLCCDIARKAMIDEVRQVCGRRGEKTQKTVSIDSVDPNQEELIAKRHISEDQHGRIEFPSVKIHEKDRLILWLRFVHGLEFSEIGKMMNLSYSGVRRRFEQFKHHQQLRAITWGVR